MRGIEEQRMDAPAFRQPNDAFDIDLNLFGIKVDGEPPCNKPAVSSILKGGAQLANDLTQRGACFLFVRPAPQQADEPFAAFVFGFGQRKIAENGASLLGSELDQPAIESYCEPSHQRDGKAHAASRHCGFACGQPMNSRSLLHPKISVRGCGIPNYIKATPPV
jgi:hypothetical protein